MSPSLLPTKLYAPRAGRVSVPRERLYQKLDRALEVRCTGVIAPAGFGKTTLVTQWLRHRKLNAAWYSVESRDAQATRFWSYVAAACDGLDGVALPETRALLEATDPDVEAVADTLAGELSEASPEAPVLLVLDDLHALESSEVMASLALLLDYAPDVFHLVFTSRSDPSLPLSRYRARGHFAEIRQQDLRFSQEEVASYLHETLGRDVAGEAVEALETRTEGWAASLQLAALSLESLAPEDGEAFIRSFAGDDRFVMDYLVDEVLSRQPPEVHRFLLATSVLPTFTQPLADLLYAEIGGEGEAPRLEALERSGLLLIPLDRRREWYRYHHLFADLLQMRARRETGTRRLLLAASAWYEERLLMEEAIDFAFQAEDVERAAALLEEAFPRLIGRGEFATIRRTVERLPEARVLSSSGICMAMAYVEHISTNLDAARLWVDRGDAVLAERGSPEGMDENHGAHAALLRGFRAEAEQGVARAEALYTQAREGFARDGWPYLASVAEQGLAGTYLAQERLTDCLEMGRSAWRKGLDTGNFLVSSTAVNRLVSAFLARGEAGEAERICLDHLREIEDRTGGGQILVVGYARVALGEVRTLQHRLDEAEEALAEVEIRARQAKSHTLNARVLMERLHLALARTELREARRASDELDDLFRQDRVLIAIRRLHQVLRARLLLAEGSTAAAAEWLATVEPDDPFPTPTAIARGRILSALGQHREATRVLSEAQAQAEAKEAWGWALEARTVRALVLHQLRDPAALPEVAAAVRGAYDTSILRHLVDGGGAMAGLLSVAQAQGVLDDLADPRFVPHVQALLADAQTQDDEQGLLSERELDVLRLLAEGLPNKTVAERLFVSLGTVKRHTHNIYRKLGASRRSEALLRARDVGLV